MSDGAKHVDSSKMLAALDEMAKRSQIKGEFARAAFLMLMECKPELRPDGTCVWAPSAELESFVDALRRGDLSRMRVANPFDRDPRIAANPAMAHLYLGKLGKLFQYVPKFARGEYCPESAERAAEAASANGHHRRFAFGAENTQFIPSPSFSFEFCAKAIDEKGFGRLGFLAFNIVGRALFNAGILLVQSSYALFDSGLLFLERSETLASEFGFPLHEAATSKAPGETSAGAKTFNLNEKPEAQR